MRVSLTFVLIVLFCFSFISAKENEKNEGKKVFETYCWGCHHQTAMAFGPSFSAIASQRTAQEIEAMIANPEGVSKVLGYKRNAMPTLKLKPEELKAITAYILSFGSISDEDNTSKKEDNKTITKKPYPNIATVKEIH